MYNKVVIIMWENVKEKLINIIKIVKDKILILSKGEYQHFNMMLYFWGLIPGLVIVLFIQNKSPNKNNLFFSILFYILVIIYFLWHFFVSKKTLKVQPQYKITKMTKKELYKNKTKEEIKEIKKQKREDNMKKLLLLKAWDSSPAYTLIELFDIFVILTQIQRFFIIVDK